MTGFPRCRLRGAARKRMETVSKLANPVFAERGGTE
jgi:hypothetical protein